MVPGNDVNTEQDFGNQSQSDFALRVSPLALRSEPDELLRRRHRLFSEMNVRRVNSDHRESEFDIRTLTVIPATRNRPAREIESSFSLIQMSSTTAAFVSNCDSDTYLHSVGRIESSVYPFAIRPYLPVESALEILTDMSTHFNLSLEVMHMRAASKTDKTKLQLHGPMTVSQVLQRISNEERILQSVRVRASNVDGSEGFRLRVDSRCRLMIERWQLAMPFMRLTEALIDTYSTIEEFRRGERLDVLSSDSNIYRIDYRFANSASGMKFLQSRLQKEKGVTTFPLDERTQYPLMVVDFISGYECTISPLEDNTLAITSVQQPHESFMNRLISLISQIEDSNEEE